MNEKGNLWRKVGAIKYGGRGFGWFPSTPNGSYGYIAFGGTKVNCKKMEQILSLIFL